MKLCSLISLFFCLLFFTRNAAQEQLGLRLDNYSGINSVILNPAYHMTSPFSWDVNLVAGAQFIDNNYVYLRQTSLLNLLKDPELKFLFGPDLDKESTVPPGSRVVDFFNDKRSRYAYILSSMMGPSLFIRLNEQHTIGAYTRARALGSSRGIPTEFSYYDYYSRPFFEAFEVTPFNMGVIGMSEIGLNYLYEVPTAEGRLGLGITAKVLLGYEAAFLHNEAAFQLTKLPGDSLSGTPIAFDFGYTTSNLNGSDFKLQRNGLGFGLDLGMVYTIGESENSYKLKLGVSLLDIGLVSFNKTTERHRVQSDSIRTIGTLAYQSFNEVTDFEEKIRLFSRQMLDDSLASFQTDKFNIWLPTALSLQLDYALAGPFYINATFVQGIPLSNVSAKRGSLLALTPRLEHRWFGAAVPVSLYNWQHFRFGLALRLAFLTVGTDNLGSFIQRSDLSGTDFYFALKFNPFSVGGDGGNKRSKTKTSKAMRFGKNQGVDCYKF